MAVLIYKSGVIYLLEDIKFIIFFVFLIGIIFDSIYFIVGIMEERNKKVNFVELYK